MSPRWPRFLFCLPFIATLWPHWTAIPFVLMGAWQGFKLDQELSR